MADAEEYDAGGEGGNERLAEDTVDDSLLRIPTFKWAEGAKAGPSGEENEDVLYKQRAKLFRSVKSEAGAEWKERGTGDVKLLADRETGRVRLLMRQEKTLKVIANHIVRFDQALVAPGGSDKFWTWTTPADASDEGEVKPETFLLKFGQPEPAAAFKVAHDAARETNRKIAESGKSLAAKPVAAAAGGAGGAGASPAKAAPAAAAPAAAAAKADKSGPIPVLDSLEAIYGAAAAGEAATRYGSLTESFRAAFDGAEPSFFVRAPGRVNLIGEHIDYHGYSVLPMALCTQDVVIAVAVGEPAGPVVVANTNPKYGQATLPTDPKAPVDLSGGPKWWQYVQCGYKGAFDFAAAHAAGGAPEPRGLRILIDGRVPAGAGVSSSSALVVASLLAVARANGIDGAASMTRAQLGEAGRVCELYIGTMSGGMDQAISSMGNAGTASLIDFEPLGSTPVALPAGAVFVVSNTLEESAKAVDAEKRYNKRVTEGKLAAKLTAKGAGVGEWSTITSFRHLQEKLGLASPADLLPLISAHLKAGAYTPDAVAAQAGLSGAGDLPGLFIGDGKRAGAEKVLSSVAAGEAAFELLKRARHVASEAGRVYAFRDASAGVGIEGDASARLAAMGTLMSESHASCRDDYECSSPGLDALTSLATTSGALGSRLTGAGWGGCAVSLVPASQLAAFKEALVEGYYKPRGLAGEVATALFDTTPGAGAAVYTPPTSFEI